MTKTIFNIVLSEIKGDRRVTVFTSRILHTVVLNGKQLQTYFQYHSTKFTAIASYFTTNINIHSTNR